MCSVIVSQSYFKPLKRALNRSGVTGFRALTRPIIGQKIGLRETLKRCATEF